MCILPLIKPLAMSAQQLPCSHFSESITVTSNKEIFPKFRINRKSCRYVSSVIHVYRH